MKNLNQQLLKENIENRVNQDLKEGKVGGVDIIVNQNGKRIYQNVFGYKSIGGEKLAENTIFRACSMTKPITAVAVLKEVEKKNICLEDDVSCYLDGYKNMQIATVDDNNEIISLTPTKNSIKVKHLLSHTSGIVAGKVKHLSNLIPDEYNQTLAKSVEYFSDKPIGFEPYTQESYSTVSFDVVARIVEKVSGIEFDKYLKQNIFDKLGMVDTTFAPQKEQWDRMIIMHSRDENGKAINGKSKEGCVFCNIPTTHFYAGAVTASNFEIDVMNSF